MKALNKQEPRTPPRPKGMFEARLPQSYHSQTFLHSADDPLRDRLMAVDRPLPVLTEYRLSATRRQAFRVASVETWLQRIGWCVVAAGLAVCVVLQWG